MERGQKHKFTFKLWYFKPNGKFYTEHSYEYECATLLSSTTPQPYINDVVAHIRGRRDSGGQSALPGLTGEWDGSIVVFHEPDGFPTLILPNPV